ncbi:MAG: two-component regulator propeller domain-containing protein [Cyclobacteriaceae bacterium]
MNKYLYLTYLSLVITLTFSCVEKKTSQKEMSQSKWVSTARTDTLKFTSGIRAIFQDSQGNYWLGSHNEGVSYYDGKSFEYFTINEGLSDNQIRSIKEDKNGNIWFGTANGVSVYKGGKFTNYSTKTNEPIFEWSETNGDLWFYANERDGINRFDGINLNYLIFPKPNYLIFPKPKTENPHNSYGVTGISIDKKGKVWMATYAALFSYDGEVTKVFDNKYFSLNDNGVLHIRSVLADSKGRIWIGNNGIGALLMENDKTINFSEINGLIHKHSSKSGSHSPPGTMEHIFAIEEDSEGNIWFGDRDTGAWKYDGETTTNYTINDNLATPMIWTIYKDNNNNLLFGMADGQVYKFNGKSFDKFFLKQEAIWPTSATQSHYLNQTSNDKHHVKKDSKTNN